jgi:MFS transporter, PPP family, 3-phenylpropionic acid transporter
MTPSVKLAFFYFVYFALLGLLAPYLGLYLEAEGFSAVEIAELSALMMATKIIAPNVWGAVADRYQNRMRLVRIGAFATLVGYLLFLRANGFWFYALAIVVFSFFWNAILPQFEVVTLHSLAEQRDRYSRIRLWGSLGFIVSVSGLGAWFDVFGLHWFPWLTLAVVAIIAAASLMAFSEPVLALPEPGQASRFWRRCMTPAIRTFFLITFLLQCSHGAYYTYFSLYLAQLGYGEITIGALWSLGVLAEVVLFIYMHRWLGFSSVRTIMLWALSLTLLRWLLIAGFADSLLVLVFAQLLHALSFGAMHAVSIHFVHQMFAPEHQGRAQALYSSVGFGAGGAAGALCSGWLFLYVQNYAASFLLCAGFALLAAWQVLRHPLKD